MKTDRGRAGWCKLSNCQLLLFGPFFCFFEYSMADNQHNGEMIRLHTPANG
jgi:hypothetical protein